MTKSRQGPLAKPRPLRFDGAAFVLLLLMFVVGAGGTPLALAQPNPSSTPTPELTSPPPTSEMPPDISGVWHVTRSWFRNCPGACDWPVIQGATWNITQTGSEFRVDRGPHGSLDGRRRDGWTVHLTGIESDGFRRFDFYYGGVYLSPDGTTMSGQFFGSETIQNPCGLANPIVTCFAQAGSFLAVRSSPPTPPQYPTATLTPPLDPPGTATPTLPTATATPTSPAPTPTAPPTATPTRQPETADRTGRRYLPLVIRLSPQ